MCCRTLVVTAVAMSDVLLLYVDWGALQAECLRRDTCDIWEVRYGAVQLEALLEWRGMRVCSYYVWFYGWNGASCVYSLPSRQRTCDPDPWWCVCERMCVCWFLLCRV